MAVCPVSVAGGAGGRRRQLRVVLHFGFGRGRKRAGDSVESVGRSRMGGQRSAAGCGRASVAVDWRCWRRVLWRRDVGAGGERVVDGRDGLQRHKARMRVRTRGRHRGGGVTTFVPSLSSASSADRWCVRDPRANQMTERNLQAVQCKLSRISMDDPMRFEAAGGKRKWMPTNDEFNGNKNNIEYEVSPAQTCAAVRWSKLLQRRHGRCGWCSHGSRDESCSQLAPRLEMFLGKRDGTLTCRGSYLPGPTVLLGRPADSTSRDDGQAGDGLPTVYL